MRKMNVFWIKRHWGEDDKHFEEITRWLSKYINFCEKVKPYRDVVSVVCWNRSPTCRIDSPVTHVYRNIANCSSRVILRDSPNPRALSFSSNASNTCLCIPSSFRIRSGCPFISSSTQSSPDSADVWYGILLYNGVANASVAAPTTCTKILAHSIATCLYSSSASSRLSVPNMLSSVSSSYSSSDSMVKSWDRIDR